MKIPTPPASVPLPRVTPSLYEALLACRAKALWSAHGQRNTVPRHPAALLGTCFHDVIEAAASGTLDGDEPRAAARELFDQLAADAHDEAHPLLRTKFAFPERMPYYHLLRERAALLAQQAARRTADESIPGDGRTAILAETTLTSRDGLIVGRPDKLDADRAEVTDFKTGNVTGEIAWSVTDREARQVRIYAYLAAENSIEVRRGTIVRGGGQTASVELTAAAAESEADTARAELKGFNDAVAAGADFAVLARPSPDACRSCPCVPFCPAFWEQSHHSWLGDTGAHAEGRIVSVSDSVVQGTRLLSLELEVSRGTVPAGPAWVEHVPADWITADGSDLPSAGDWVRLVDGRTADSDTPTVIRPDRVMTAIWMLDTPPAET